MHPIVKQLEDGSLAACRGWDRYNGTEYAAGSIAERVSATPTWTPMPGPTTGLQWIPIGGTTPVPVTPAEETAILSGIAARTNTLAGKKNTKVAEVKALTAIPDVIDYDVTTGWSGAAYQFVGE